MAQFKKVSPNNSGGKSSRRSDISKKGDSGKRLASPGGFSKGHRASSQPPLRPIKPKNNK